jgi:hypothetical protein
MQLALTRGDDMWGIDGRTFGKAGSGGTIDLDVIPPK